MNLTLSQSRLETDNQAPQHKIITLANSGDERRAREVLKSELELNPDFNVLELTDARGYTLLHISALNSLKNVVNFLFSIIKEKVSDANTIKGYVNAQTDEGFTALHFSAFRGDIKLIKLLEELGADIRIPNFQGLNVLHIAAQGDQPVSIVKNNVTHMNEIMCEIKAYFLKKGLDVGSRDLKGSTALHWAAFLGCENSTNFLTVWNADPNLTDKEGGLTPLHLAVVSGNTRIVRRLLIKGADRNISTKDGKLAMDLAEESNFDNIVLLLRRSNLIVECCNIRPGLGDKRSKSSLVLFFFLYFVPLVIDVFFVFPYVTELWQIFTFIGLFILSTLSFLFAWIADPGYLPKNDLDTILKLLEKHECFNICPECAILKPPRSRHCELCRRCVQVFDHHCPWIDNCVGARNHGYFYMFIVTVLLNLIFLVFFSIYSFFQSGPPNFNIVHKFFEDENLYFLIKDGCCVFTGVLSLLFFFPLWVLVYVQTKNLLLDKTTNERYGHNQKKEADTTSVSQELDKKVHVQDGDGYSALYENSPPASRCMYFNNCFNVCCRNATKKEYQELKQSVKS